MTAASTISVLVGLCALLLLGVDVVVTVFYPDGHGGPITRTQIRAVWRLFRTVGVRKDGQPRDKLLEWCGPVAALSSILSWVALLVLGFALLYYPTIRRFATWSAVTLDTTISDSRRESFA